jgi:hypothetical protein
MSFLLDRKWLVHSFYELQDRYIYQEGPTAENVDTRKLNSLVLVRERTIPTERPTLVGEVSANFLGQNVSRSQRRGSPTAVFSAF